ncbi:MAG: hypothetical protein QOF62_187 [Pyrinomonadaceae bacterium]|jgi:hypothetical protein|nr:hypothetical protein [Pyrinomonadaceae bacterium]
MSEQLIGDDLWAEMTDGQKLAAVVNGRASLKQIGEGLLDGSEALRSACQQISAHTRAGVEKISGAAEAEGLNELAETLTKAARRQKAHEHHESRTTKLAGPQVAKQRFGLPEGFVPRLQRYGRAVLLELNVYRLPDGQEFIPCRPSGTLGGRQHLYALVTNEQYLQERRGSVYVRTDGRIFDYSVDMGQPDRDMFDTGYTLYDLERTGRYAPVPRRRQKRKKSQPAKVRRAAAG